MINTESMKATEIKKYISNILQQDCDFDYENLINILKNDSRKTVQKLSDTVSKFIENKEKEISRVKTMYEFDKSKNFEIYLAGVDEVGRGPLAGPIVAAAVIIDLNYKDDKDLILKINDSKKLTPHVREELSEIIKKRAISYCIAEIGNDEIDDKGIAWCNNEVLKRASNRLKVRPDLVLSDGYAIKNSDIKNDFVIKGDSKSASIACASIIAKVYRDNLMKEYSVKYPNYNFEKNMGYGTKDHINAIKEFGYTSIHRMSFLNNILNMF